jgi:hypothetical protein
MDPTEKARVLDYLRGRWLVPISKSGSDDRTRSERADGYRALMVAAVVNNSNYSGARVDAILRGEGPIAVACFSLEPPILWRRCKE